MITIDDRIKEIFGKDNVIMAGWNKKFEDGEKVYDCSTDIEIPEGDRLGIELAAAHLLAVLVTNMEPESLDTQVTILAQINTLAAQKAAGFCKDKVTYKDSHQGMRKDGENE